MASPRRESAINDGVCYCFMLVVPCNCLMHTLYSGLVFIVLGYSRQDHGGMAAVFCVSLAHFPWNRSVAVQF